jgi:hypothetical protein
VDFEPDLRDQPVNLLHGKILWRTEGSRGITEHTVVDCGTSAVFGDNVVLEDGLGGRKQVTVAEFYELRDT